MSKKKIQDKSFGYELVKSVIHFMYPKFFRQIEIRGLENVPDNEPLIFAGNHQNGVMDPFSIILYQKEPIVYMGRADIFSNPLFRVLLRFIKVTPVYRIRDGFENLSKNDRQIKEAIDVLLDFKRLGVMPEGNHGEQHKLRPLVKGLFRIGYQAEILMENKAHVKIIPVGIDYSFYQHAGSDLVLTYGKPIEIKDYLPTYLENQAAGLNVLRTKLAAALSELMLDIRSQDYDRTYRLCCYGVAAFLEVQAERGLETNAITLAGLRYDARYSLARLFDWLEVEDPKQMQQLDAYTSNLNRLPGSPSEIMEWMEDNPSFSNPLVLGLIAIVLTPGFILNLPAWSLNRLIVSNIEDKQMHATFVFTLGMAFNLLVYMALTVFLGSLLGAKDLQFLILFFFISSLGIISEKGRQHLRIPWRKFSHSFGKRKLNIDRCKADYLQLKAMIRSII